MFGQVQEDSFQSIFDLSLDSLSLEDNNTRCVLGGGLNASTRDNNTLSSSLSLLSSKLNNSQQQQTNDRKTQPNPWNSNDLCLGLLQGFSHKTPSNNCFEDSNNTSIDRQTIAQLLSAGQLQQFQNFQEQQQQHSFKQQERNRQQQSNDLAVGNSRKQQPFNILYDHDDGSNSSSCSDSSTSSSCSSLSAGNSKVNTSRYKTEMCRPFQENGSCKYGDKCQFAHGAHEMRSIARHPKYKTDLCRTYHSSGFCPYGPRCHFIHNLEEVTAGNNRNSGNASLAAQNSPSAVGSPPSDKDKENNGIKPLPMFSSKMKSNSNNNTQLPQPTHRTIRPPPGLSLYNPQQGISSSVAVSPTSSTSSSSLVSSTSNNSPFSFDLTSLNSSNTNNSSNGSSFSSGGRGMTCAKGQQRLPVFSTFN